MAIVPQDYIGRLNTIASALEQIRLTVGRYGHARPEEFVILQKFQNELKGYSANPSVVGQEKEVAGGLLEVTNDLIAYDVEARASPYDAGEDEYSHMQRFHQPQTPSSEPSTTEGPKVVKCPWGDWALIDGTEEDLQQHIAEKHPEGAVPPEEPVDEEGYVKPGLEEQEPVGRLPPTGVISPTPTDYITPLSQKQYVPTSSTEVIEKDEAKTVFPTEGLGFYTISCTFCGEEFSDKDFEVAKFKAREHAAEVHMKDPLFQMAKEEIEGVCGVHRKDFKQHSPIEIMEDVEYTNKVVGLRPTYPIVVHTEEMMEGKKMEGMKKCEECNGSGYAIVKTKPEGDKYDYCANCGGSGNVPKKMEERSHEVLAEYYCFRHKKDYDDHTEKEIKEHDWYGKEEEQGWICPYEDTDYGDRGKWAIHMNTYHNWDESQIEDFWEAIKPTPKKILPEEGSLTPEQLKEVDDWLEDRSNMTRFMIAPGTIKEHERRIAEGQDLGDATAEMVWSYMQQLKEMREASWADLYKETHKMGKDIESLVKDIDATVP